MCVTQSGLNELTSAFLEPETQFQTWGYISSEFRVRLGVCWTSFLKRGPALSVVWRWVSPLTPSSAHLLTLNAPKITQNITSQWKGEFLSQSSLFWGNACDILINGVSFSSYAPFALSWWFSFPYRHSRLFFKLMSICVALESGLNLSPAELLSVLCSSLCSWQNRMCTIPTAFHSERKCRTVQVKSDFTI